MPKSLCSVAALSLLLAACGRGTPVAVPTFHSYFTDRETYEEYYRVAESGEHPSITERVSGAIVPHHMYVGPEFARFYDALREQHPPVIVIIGPNHFEAGKADVQTTRGSYVTPYGTVTGAAGVIDELLARGVTTEEERPFIEEHSISAEVAFIKKTFPNATLVPLILKARVSRKSAENLGHVLSEVLPSDALVLASVDFSHYLPEPVADFHDQTSRAALLNFDIDAVQSLEVDSPSSLTAFLTYLRDRKAQNLLYEKHTNSASYGAHPEFTETTSHFFLAFGDGRPQTSPAASVFFTGDTIIDRGVTDRMQKLATPDAVLDGVAGKEDRFFYGSTINALNLEGPVTTRDVTAVPGKIGFHFDPMKTAAILKRMHINIASLANNHSDDAGKDGRDDTENFLRGRNMEPVGISNSCITRPAISGTIAICAFFDGGGFLNVTEATRMITEAKKNTDFVVVSVHWGKEYSNVPSNRQRELAQAFVAAGADAVFGHGPHVKQSLENVEGSPVFFSLGNFLFDEASPERSSGLAGGVFFGPEGTHSYAFPLHTINAMPTPYSYAERMKSP